MATDLYAQVTDNNDQIIENASARVNQPGYFAELTAIYFVGGNDFPFDKLRSKRYDTQGYEMIVQLWLR
jgi:hypothetical protein